VAAKISEASMITAPTADLNLGIKTFLNGTLVSNIILDTTSQATVEVSSIVPNDIASASQATSTAP
jgi:hypothetical protein